MTRTTRSRSAGLSRSGYQICVGFWSWLTPIGTKASESLAHGKRQRASENIVKKKTEKRRQPDDLRREYDLSKLEGGVRGKYIGRYKDRTNLVLLSPEVAAHFPDDQSVNRALRKLIRVAKSSVRRGR